MTEQSVETTQVTLILPVLHPSQTPRDAVAHLAHMFNDLGEHPPFEEIGKYGPKTTAARQEAPEGSRSRANRVGGIRHLEGAAGTVASEVAGGCGPAG
jgi:hypothetical protein